MMLALLTAHAVTPEQLAEAVPDARRQLVTCANAGCTPEQGAKAAYLVAVHTYTSEGAAEGGLAATVRLLDPDLFATLPPVLQDAATWPAAWALASDLGPHREAREALARHPDPGPYEADPKLPRASFTVVVVDARTGEPVPATLRFRDEDTLHRVHHETGTWTGTVRYLPDGSERYFQKGDTLRLDVTAPGYDYQKAAIILPRRKENLIRLQLTPWSPAADGSPEAERALAAHEAWVKAEQAAIPPPTEERIARVAEARLTAAVRARAWIDAGGAADATSLCLQVGTPLYCE